MPGAWAGTAALTTCCHQLQDVLEWVWPPPGMRVSLSTRQGDVGGVEVPSTQEFEEGGGVTHPLPLVGNVEWVGNGKFKLLHTTSRRPSISSRACLTWVLSDSPDYCPQRPDPQQPACQ